LRAECLYTPEAELDQPMENGYRLSALGSEHSALSTQQSALGSQHSAVSTQHSALGTQLRRRQNRSC